MSSLPYPVYDADNHFYETAESFTRHLPKKFRNAIQYVNVNGRTKLAVGGLISNYIPNPTFDKVAAPGTHIDFFTGNNPEGKSLREMSGTPADCLQGWRTAGERLNLMDQQGLDATLMFPTLVSAVEERLAQHDLEATKAVMHSLNQWMLEEWGFNKNERIFSAPVITLADVDWAVRELEWAMKNGAHTVLVRPAPVPNVAGSRSPGFREFDPFWARVNESRLFVTMHGSDSGYDRFVRMWQGGTEFLPFEPDPFGFVVKPNSRAISDSMAALVCHGVFERHPDVRVTAIENGGAWVGDLVNNLKKVGKMFPKQFKSDPVEQFREHVYVAPFFEDSTDDLRTHIGSERILFGSDYPHPEGVEDPMEFLGKLENFDDRETEMIMGGNLKELIDRVQV